MSGPYVYTLSGAYPTESDLAICNIALGRIGQSKPITSLDTAVDRSEAARLCALHYERCRDRLLRRFWWRFSLKQKALVASADVRTGWGYVYDLPDDCLKVRRIWNGSRRPATDEGVPFSLGPNDTLDGQLVFCDQANAELLYTARLTDPTMFPPPFSDALEWMLAIDLSYPLKVDRSTRADAFAGFQDAIAEARTDDIEQGTEDAEPDSIFERARS